MYEVYRQDWGNLPPTCVSFCVTKILSLRCSLIQCYQGVHSIVDSCSKLFKFKKVITYLRVDDFQRKTKFGIKSANKNPDRI